jgi:hypothetical protein
VETYPEMTESSGDQPPPLPGKCVEIPFVRAEVRDLSGRIFRIVETHVVPGLDLDGYGSPVVLVPPDRKNLNLFNMHWRLFIQRGDCGHELGTVIGLDEPFPEPGESEGLRNFSVAEPVQPGMAGEGFQGVSITVYSFDGRRYLGGRSDYR